MLAVVRSEMVRLRRPKMLVLWFGLMGFFALMVNTVMFGTASSGTTLPAGAPGVRFPDAATLAGPDGLVAGLAAASSMFGVVTLSFWALATATDYSSGLIRLLVAAQPHRWRLLAGKIVALLIVTAAAVAVATIVTVIAALPAAQGAGISTSDWMTESARDHRTGLAEHLPGPHRVGGHGARPGSGDPVSGCGHLGRCRVCACRGVDRQAGHRG